MTHLITGRLYESRELTQKAMRFDRKQPLSNQTYKIIINNIINDAIMRKVFYSLLI